MQAFFSDWAELSFRRRQTGWLLTPVLPSIESFCSAYRIFTRSGGTSQFELLGPAKSWISNPKERTAHRYSVRTGTPEPWSRRKASSDSRLSRTKRDAKPRVWWWRCLERLPSIFPRSLKCQGRSARYRTDQNRIASHSSNCDDSTIASLD